MPYMKDEKIRAHHYEITMESKIDKIKAEIRSNNRAKDLESKLRRIKKTKTISENLNKVLEYDSECAQNNLKQATRYSILISLHNLCQFAGEKSFTDFTKADIVNFLDAAKNRRFEDTRYRVRTNNVEKQLADSSMNLLKLHMKKFFQWLHHMENKEYPENIRWMRVKPNSNYNSLTAEDLPTPEDIRSMIECTDNARDRALISLLAESGVRCGEASTLLLEDLNWREEGFILTIHAERSKSKETRKIPLCACSEDVKSYINNFHPFKGDDEAPLFVSFVNRTTPRTNLKVAGIGTIVTKIAKRSGVEKRIHMYPHLFRHNRASQLAELGWNEPMLRKFFGWSKFSKMPSLYIHMSQKSLYDRYYQMYGKVKPETHKPIMLGEAPRCAQCGMHNPNGYRFCFHCNTPLDKEEQMCVDGEMQAKKWLNFVARDPKLSKKLFRLMKEAELKEKLGHTC